MKLSFFFNTNTNNQNIMVGNLYYILCTQVRKPFKIIIVKILPFTPQLYNLQFLYNVINGKCLSYHHNELIDSIDRLYIRQYYLIN